MAVMIRWSENHQAFFKVFELAQSSSKDDAHDYRWVELHNLDDYALFLGPTLSRVVHVPMGRRGGVERNHIYYSYFRSLYVEEKEFDGKSHLTRSRCGDPMYSREDHYVGEGEDGVQQIPALGYYIFGGPYVPMWCFPPDF
jgi:hypothetical protein